MPSGIPERGAGDGGMGPTTLRYVLALPIGETGKTPGYMVKCYARDEME